ncbi:hypothetical protein B0A48_16816 [Cryoendolithus antarcticus]|uniref:Major facilitator superfamily (MFS) profile domain-containing protein n=1 Tax=Cryoendolithus antarcticus TaxID=1507870 RepID=A0A1V8SDL5_9PEZI|nr:hypothetical protein B0A48_16816 [Cryoendolithus antarcticus]
MASAVEHDVKRDEMATVRSVGGHATGDRDTDQAYAFLKAHAAEGGVSELAFAPVRRKVDWRLIPVLFLVYAMNLIDKVSLNYAAVMGLPKDLKLGGNDITNTATAFFAAYLVAEIPTVFILNKFPAGKWLAINVVGWGIACACTAAAKNYATLVTARVFLGIFEARVVPCMILISSQYYTKSEQSSRFAFWYCGLGVGQIVGGLLSFAFQHVQNPHFQGWRVMWLVLGIVTVVLGVVTWFALPDSPMAARFLTDAEKSAVLQHVSVNKTGVLNTHFKPAQILEAAGDPQIWLLALMTVLPSISAGVVTTYSATLIRGFGYSSKTAALLNVPSGAISIVACLTCAFAIQYGSNRFAWYIACCIPGIIAGALLSFLPKTAKGGLLAGIYLINCITPTVIITYQWTASNTGGATKRAFASTLMSAAFGVGNILGPQTFQARDAPRYLPAKHAVLATQCAAAALALVLLAYYKRSNDKKDRSGNVGDEASDALDEENWANLTDKQNKTFRYVY